MFRLVLGLLAIAAAAAALLALLPGEPPEPRTAAATAPAPAPSPPLAACPERLPAETASLRCRCTAEATALGSVWGSEVYTDDSAICRAALHAGRIGVEGGPVLVVAADGREGYSADIRHSVASRSWEGWPRSIDFPPAEP